MILKNLLILLLFCPLASGVVAFGAPEPQTEDTHRLIQLGVGDAVSVRVYGQPDMDGVVAVSDDGTINLPLIGAVNVVGLSPIEAAKRIQEELKNRQLLIDPQVTIAVVQSHSQRVSVLGEVHTPGRYPIDAATNVVDLLAQAGGITPAGADYVYVLRPDSNGHSQRFLVDLKGITNAKDALPTQSLQGGDSVYVPQAEQFYIYGEVGTPGMYRLEPGMTVLQAIARAGGVTPRGSERRLEIKRTGKNGKSIKLSAKPDDELQSGDIVRVKESIF
jgi:polysaccharide biosynthesis/export protein